LAALARVTGVMAACRLVYAAYAVTFALGFASLVRALAEDDPRVPGWTALAGPLLVWHPVACLRFLPLMLGFPVLFRGAAEALGWLRAGKTRHAATVGLAGAAMPSIHLVGAAFFLVFLALLALARPSRRSLCLFAIASASVLSCLAAWQAAGPGHLAAM